MVVRARSYNVNCVNVVGSGTTKPNPISVQQIIEFYQYGTSIIFVLRKIINAKISINTAFGILLVNIIWL